MLQNEFFAGLGSLICSMTLGGGELSPIERELILEKAEGIFPSELPGKSRRKAAAWRSMFALSGERPSDPDSLAVFWRWMELCDEREWCIPPAWGSGLLQFILEIGRTYGLSSERHTETFRVIAAELKRRSGFA
jgi:hypothetical protein